MKTKLAKYSKPKISQKKIKVSFFLTPRNFSRDGDIFGFGIEKVFASSPTNGPSGSSSSSAS